METRQERNGIISERILHAEGVGGRVVVFRVKPGFDAIEAIKQVCSYYHIEAGVISSFFGSLERVKLGIPYEGLSFPIPSDAKPSTIVRTNVLVGSGSGLVNTLQDGTVAIHLHVVTFDGGLSDMPVAAGHVETDEPAPAHGTIEVAIQEIKGMRLVRRLDEEVGRSVTFPEEE